MNLYFFSDRKPNRNRLSFLQYRPPIGTQLLNVRVSQGVVQGAYWTSGRGLKLNSQCNMQVDGSQMCSALYDLCSNLWAPHLHLYIPRAEFFIFILKPFSPHFLQFSECTITLFKQKKYIYIYIIPNQHHPIEI